jgi:hypothetical protein
MPSRLPVELDEALKVPSAAAKPLRRGQMTGSNVEHASQLRANAA